MKALSLKNGTHERAAEFVEVQVQKGDAAHANMPLRIFRLSLRLLFKLAFQVRVVGLDNLPAGQSILCLNHLGWTDAFLPLLLFPVEPRIYVVGEKEVARISGFRNRMIDRLKIMVPLDRDRPREALRTMQDVMSRGGSVLIFPEGQLGITEGHLQDLKHGAAHLSLVSGFPLVPVGLTGTSELWLGRRLTVRIGKPIYPSEWSGDTRDRIRTGTKELHASLLALLPGDSSRAKVKLLKGWLTKLL